MELVVMSIGSTVIVELEGFGLGPVAKSVDAVV